MSRYTSYVSHQVMDDLFNLEPEVRKVFQDKLDALEREPFKGSTMVPADKSNDPGWVSRVAGSRTLISLGTAKYRMVLHFKVGPSQLKVHAFMLHLVEAEGGDPPLL